MWIGRLEVGSFLGRGREGREVVLWLPHFGIGMKGCLLCGSNGLSNAASEGKEGGLLSFTLEDGFVIGAMNPFHFTLRFLSCFLR